ncbi:hypothetical protein [Vulcanisaeta thermophila]|uniref:hypothetical protein n=1 Tax=Vulcanisaeta thermophila TaxID=867917 RepID=UPI000852B32A|nr:hypothetical protein [Vulcanisaeta thermophila]
MNSPFKIFLLISIPLILLSLILIYGTALIAPSIVRISTPQSMPYAQASNVIVNTSGVYVVVSVVNNGFNFTPTGGWAFIVNTGELGNLTIINGTLATSRMELEPSYAMLSSVGVKGVIKGYLNGAPAEIAFFSVVPIHVVNTVDLSSVNYSNCVLTLTFNVASIVPVRLWGIVNMSLYTAVSHEYIINTMNVVFNESAYVPAGNHTVTITIPIAPLYGTNKFIYVYDCNLRGGGAYVLYLPMNITYYYPTVNQTVSTVIFKTFTG